MEQPQRSPPDFDVRHEDEEHHCLLTEKNCYRESGPDLYCCIKMARSKSARWQRSGTVALIVLQITLCILLLVNLLRPIWSFLQPRSRHDWGPLHEITFGSNVDYMSLDHKYDELWSDEESAYKALVRTNPDQAKSEAQWGSIAMFHQLHCLTSFRTALQRAQDGLNPGMDNNDNKHWPHCFWYLRQAILCHADDQIELPHILEEHVLPNGETETRRTGSINGVDDTRTCRDSERLYRLRSEHGAEAAGYKIDLEAERTVSEGLIRNKTQVEI